MRLQLLRRSCFVAGVLSLAASCSAPNAGPAADAHAPIRNLRVQASISKVTSEFTRDEELIGRCVFTNLGDVPLTLLVVEIEVADPHPRPVPVSLMRWSFSESTGIENQRRAAFFGHRSAGIMPLSPSCFRVLAPRETWECPRQWWVTTTRQISEGTHTVRARYCFHKPSLDPGYLPTEAVRALWEAAAEGDAESPPVEFDIPR